MKVRALALTAGSEDYTGLYELLAELERIPDMSLLERRAVASNAIVGLLNEGLLNLFSTTWASEEYKVIPRDRAELLLADPQSWQLPPTDGQYVAFANTAVGDAVYQTLPPGIFEGLW